MYCPSCNRQIPDGVAFCGLCGAQTGPGAAPPQQPPASPPQAPYQPVAGGYAQPPAPERSGGGSSCLTIGCVALAVVLIVGGVGGYFGWRYLKARAAQTIQDIGNDLGPTTGDAGDRQPDPDQGDAGGTAPGADTGPANQGGAQRDGGSGAGQDLPSPMQRLNAFLEAAGGSDGSRMLPFMTGPLQATFAQTAEIWGQGDFDHVGWNVGTQTRISDTEWQFQVTQRCRDWNGGALFYNTYAVGMTWSGSDWQVSRFDMVDR